MSENPKAANEARDKIKAENQYQHLGTTSEEARLLAASTGGAKAQATKPLAEVAVDQGTRLHNFQDSDSVAADLQKQAGEGTFEEGEPGSTVPEALEAQGVAPEVARGEVSGRQAADAQRESNQERSVKQTDTPEALGDMKVPALRARARSLKITGYGDMKKDDLIKEIEKAQ